MPRKKGIFSGGHSVARVKAESRVSPTQESLADVVRRNAIENANHNPYSLYAQDFGFLRTFLGFVNENILTGGYVHDNYDVHDNDDDDYGEDGDDDEEDDDDDDYDDGPYKPWPHTATLTPHPNLRQLTQEEADKHTKELADKEEQQKEKLEKNKQKKLRRKERKRLEKEKENRDKLPEVEQNNPKSSGSHDENTIIDESKKKTMQSNIAIPAETENKSVDRDSTRSSDDPDEQLKGEDIHPEDIKSFTHQSTRGQSKSPVTGQRKGGGRKKKKTKSVERRGPEREETPEREESPEREALPVVSQTPPLPEDASSDKKENINGTIEDYSQKTTELAAAGHRLASCGQYEMAVQCFTDAIKYNPKEYKLFGNRSFCYERLQQYEPALQDADTALSLDPHWIKGFFRRGKALCGLKRYYEASLTYKNILKHESSSVEASQELKRAQTLHLMEMGFSWPQACQALKEHATLEEAVDALFGEESEADGASCGEYINQQVEEEEEEEEEEEAEEQEQREEDEGEWTVLRPSRPPRGRRENAASPKPVDNPKRELFSVWVGSLAPTLTIPTLHKLFNRAGAVSSVKMLIEQQCAFINYTRIEDCHMAIKLMDGLLVEGTPLAVRYPNRYIMRMKSPGGSPRPASRNLKECFFWRTSGCTKPESCIYKHVPEHKHIDRDKLRQ